MSLALIMMRLHANRGINRCIVMALSLVLPPLNINAKKTLELNLKATMGVCEGHLHQTYKRAQKQDNDKIVPNFWAPSPELHDNTLAMLSHATACHESFVSQ